MAQMPFRRAIYHILVLTVLVLNRDSGQISVGDKATIWTEGDESFAVYGIHADSTLYVGKDAEISTQGDKASAVRGGNITKVYDFTAAGGKITIDEGLKSKLWGSVTWCRRPL